MSGPLIRFTVVSNDDRVMKALVNHIALANDSYKVLRGERAFLDTLFPALPNLDERMTSVMGHGSKPGLEDMGIGTPKLARVQAILNAHRNPPPDLVLAAAEQWTIDELKAFSTWCSSAFNEHFGEFETQRSYGDGLTTLDLDDPGGRLPVDAIVGARRIIRGRTTGGLSERWPVARVRALAHASMGETVPGKVFLTGGRKLEEHEDWRFGVPKKNQIPYAVRVAGSTESGLIGLHALKSVLVNDARDRSAYEIRHRLTRCLLKAAYLE